MAKRTKLDVRVAPSLDDRLEKQVAAIGCTKNSFAAIAIELLLLHVEGAKVRKGDTPRARTEKIVRSLLGE